MSAGTSAASPSQGAKGQTSFELVIVLALVLAFATALFYDISDNSLDSLVTSSVKNTAQARVAALAFTQGCMGSYLNSISIGSDKSILLNFSGCAPPLSQIADTVESQICSASPDNDAFVDCGPEQYQLGVKS